MYYAQQTGLLCVADDSGLEVDALAGAPGVFSARYSGPDATDAANRAKLLDEMAHVAAAQRTARFRCAIALAQGQQILFESEGATEGSILEHEDGDGGFGYDPLFYSHDLKESFGKAAASDKDAVSHRGRALRPLLEHLQERVRQP